MQKRGQSQPEQCWFRRAIVQGMDEERFDVVVIGAGLGGLLSAAQFVGRGQRVAVVERLEHVGGRFTAKTFQGAQVSTGAVHMLPFGTNGVLAAMLRDLQIPHAVHDAPVFGSFLVHGRMIHARSVLAFARVVGARQYPAFVAAGAAMLLRAARPEEQLLTFAQWLARQGISRTMHRETVLFFERIAHFALSVDLDQILYPEVCATLKFMLRYGPPGIVDGGSAAVAGALEQRLLAAGATVLLHHEAREIHSHDGAVAGVVVAHRPDGKVRLLTAPLVISDIDPTATHRLLHPGSARDDLQALPQATGLKVHILARRSLVPHGGILYCLDTQRIAGIVEPSNSDSRLAPPGEHLLISHQLWRPDREDIAAARALALADWEELLGPRSAGQWRVLTMSQYHGEWPVNRAVQGRDTIPTTEVHGLYLVGDAVKPSGYLMVEGVAQSVHAMMDAVDRALPASATSERHGEHASGTPLPLRRRALRWVIAPPSPHAGSTPRSLSKRDIS